MRSEEQSLINDNLFIFLTDIMLIISIFSDEVSIKNLTLFFFLLIVKCMAWLIADRVNIQKDTSIRLFITILLSQSITFSVFNLDIFFKTKSISILFSFEYVIISLLLLKSLILTFLEDPTHVFYTDISYTTLKLLSITSFFVITTIHYRIPFNVFRETVSTAKVLVKKIHNFMAYRIIINKLRECERAIDGMCPICTEDIIGEEKDKIDNSHDKESNKGIENDNISNVTDKIDMNDSNPGIKLQCSHVFHLNCLKKWVEQQQVCPVCRDNIIKKKDKKNQNNNEENNNINADETDSLFGIPVERE